MEHYFSENPNIKSKRKNILFTFNDKNCEFITDNGVFSKDHVDEGTQILIKNTLKNIDIDNLNVLDLGCGYGVVGIILKTIKKNINISFSDINNRSLELTVENLNLNNITDYKIYKSDLFENIKENFDIIISNPPIRTGKENIFKLYEQSFEHLNDNGIFLCVIMTKHGAKSTQKKLEQIYSHVICLSIENGFRVYMAKK
ncbi:class I SAM-dependent methyltransferase [Caviibacter abscessus]|uniref:class I SAM-dependent methyltransferase n=1 Tax=Caviibacter abscessus TaxID=1766719 RepID=UPI0008334BD3|nr:methyltransferase [Caviibacter abscessus]